MVVYGFFVLVVVRMMVKLMKGKVVLLFSFVFVVRLKWILFFLLFFGGLIWILVVSIGLVGVRIVFSSRVMIYGNFVSVFNRIVMVRMFSGMVMRISCYVIC